MNESSGAEWAAKQLMTWLSLLAMRPTNEALHDSTRSPMNDAYQLAYRRLPVIWGFAAQPPSCHILFLSAWPILACKCDETLTNPPRNAS